MNVLLEVSPGEALDKLTILNIKAARIADPAKLKNVAVERRSVEAAISRSIVVDAVLSELVARLEEINGRLWDLEDEIRRFEATGDFGSGFIRTARQIYATNDKRATVKREISLRFAGALIEEKGYTAY
ncbi:hypothetical protein [Methylobacterium sp. E-066]|uniref:hypothetical protein n=1 Tax=Methylobacterium sp. E-066 TaxID=2836584 RepID=UPI001FB8B786|nr:hypothetical protein [Methylobacterium sp. E-066]MCJ2142949.1 hypothetical protein [Methylobacterium sp. E-066]